MARRRSWKTPLVLAVLAAVAGHVYYWYWPRLRTADPGSAGPAASLVLAEEGLPFCVWTPYPHQNLAGLTRSDSRMSALITALQTLRGDRRRALPSFGPFPLPPGRGLGLCSDREGDRLAVVAEVYPSLARVARWSGRLAGNPWLAGGKVETGGRRLEVRWEGDVWLVGETGSGRPASPPPRTSGPFPGEFGPALGLARLREPWGALPADLYRFERSGSDLILRSASLPSGATSQAIAEAVPVRKEVPLVALVANRDSETDVRVMAMVERQGQVPGASGLPDFVVLHYGPGARWRLPREALGPLLGVEALESSVAGWTVAALESEDLENAEALVAELATLQGAVEAGLQAALWVDPRRVGPTLHGLADDLERLPIVKRRYVRAWRAAALAAGALEGSDLLTLAVEGGAKGPRLELRLKGPP